MSGPRNLWATAANGSTSGRSARTSATASFLGAVIAGRRTYDLSVPWWGADGPAGSARVPVFVVTHAEPEDAPEGSVYTFVTDGIESALEQAKAAAGDKMVAVMGGAD